MEGTLAVDETLGFWFLLPEVGVLRSRIPHSSDVRPGGVFMPTGM